MRPACTPLALGTGRHPLSSVFSARPSPHGSREQVNGGEQGEPGIYAFNGGYDQRGQCRVLRAKSLNPHPKYPWSRNLESTFHDEEPESSEGS